MDMFPVRKILSHNGYKDLHSCTFLFLPCCLYLLIWYEIHKAISPLSTDLNTDGKALYLYAFVYVEIYGLTFLTRHPPYPLSYCFSCSSRPLPLACSSAICCTIGKICCCMISGGIPAISDACMRRSIGTTPSRSLMYSPELGKL